MFALVHFEIQAFSRPAGRLVLSDLLVDHL